MKIKKLYRLFTLILLLCLSGVIAWHFIDQVPNERPKPPQFKVKVVKIERVDMPILVNSVGSLFADKTVTISPQIAGQVHAILFQNGQWVKQGQPLFQLDNQVYQAQFTAAKLALQLSKINYQRSLQLAKAGAISKQAFEKARTEYQVNMAHLEISKVALEKMIIPAPFTGIISAAKIDIGQFVQIGEPLVEVVEKSNLTVRFSVSEDYLEKINLGQLVTVKSSALPDKTFTGTVNYISPSVNPATRTVTLWGGIANPERQLAPGLFVQVILQIGVQRQVILIPQQALIPTVEGNDVYLINQGQASKKPIIIGQMVGDQVEVIKGLEAGDFVVTLGQEKLSNGCEVEVIA